MKRYLPGATYESWKSVHPISRLPWDVTNGQAWLVGDAARILEPLTGEGIYSALATGEMAALNILSIPKVGTEAAANRYRRQHRKLYGPRIWINSMVRWALEDSVRSTKIVSMLSLCPALIGLMVEWVQSPASPRLAALTSFDPAAESSHPLLQP